MQPHKIRYWLHSSEKEEEPEVFAEKVNEICEVYRHAQENSQKGDYTISTDEMTGIQALEHKCESRLENQRNQGSSDTTKEMKQ